MGAEEASARERRVADAPEERTLREVPRRAHSDRGDEHEHEPVVPGEGGERVQRTPDERDDGRDAHQPAGVGVVGGGTRRKRGQQERHVDEPCRDRRRLRGVAAGEEHPGEHELELSLHGRRQAVGADQRDRPAWDPERSHVAVQL